MKQDKDFSDRKVIPLKAKFKSEALMATSPSDLKAVSAGSLALLMVLMVGFNFSMFANKKSAITQEQNMQRGIASVPSVIHPQWQRGLAELNRNMITQAGRKPTTLESFNYGVLEGKYALNVDGGRITEIKLSHDSEDPKILNDRLRFIQDNALTLAPGFKAAEKVRVEASNVGIKETYKVDTKTGQKVFEFQIDDQDRLVSLNIK